MAKEQYISKTHKDKAGKEVVIKYRIDADFQPQEIAEISREFIENYCVANDKIDWLVRKVNETVTYTYKKGKKAGTTEEKPLPFVSLRADFANEFFPEIVKGEKKSGETFAERINRLYGKKQPVSPLNAPPRNFTPWEYRNTF